MATKKLSILGSTGSIGTGTLDIARRFPGKFTVLALAAGENDQLMAEQVKEFKPELVSMKNKAAMQRLKSRLSAPLPKLVFGEEGAIEVATLAKSDIVLSAFVGIAGLVPTLEALKLGKRVALANKETLVVAGALMTRTAREHNAELLPVDSEHSAIFQCFEGHRKADLDQIILTASGGPFLKLPMEQQKNITVEQALDHPVWKMGAKVTIDSSTLMNKGLETIEAKWLFDVSPDKIKVRIHPTSNVHSMVSYKDGSIIAQLGASDMRGPIAYALSYPERLDLPFHRFDPADSNGWEFIRPNLKQFPCLGLAFKAMEAGEGYPAILNAANEISVDRFLNKALSYLGIAKLNATVLERAINEKIGESATSLEEILNLDQTGRDWATEALKNID